MEVIEIAGEIDGQHQLSAGLPSDYPAGPVRLVVFPPDFPVAHKDSAGISWETGIAVEWYDELCDSRQDVYTMEDGHPVNARP